jgi:hypothetical protein
MSGFVYTLNLTISECSNLLIWFAWEKGGYVSEL